MRNGRLKKAAYFIVGLISCTLVVNFFFGGFTFETAPYALPTSPIVAYRITGNESDIRFFCDDPNTIHGYAIIQQQAIADPQLQHDVQDLLNSRFIYGSKNIRCFEPGIAIRFGSGDNQIDALICLTCQHIYFFRGDQVAYRNLNSNGIARIKSIYSRLFPGHSADGTDPDADRITNARNQERDKRDEASLESATRPATQLGP